MNAGQLLVYVIRPTLRKLAEKSELPLASNEAELLLLATAAQESSMGEYLHQVGGPARGIYQMEPATIEDTENRIKRWPKLEWAINDSFFSWAEYNVEGNLQYATALARAKYWLVPHPLPAADCWSLWFYYKQYWNTDLGAATPTQFAANFSRYVDPVLT